MQIHSNCNAFFFFQLGMFLKPYTQRVWLIILGTVPVIAMISLFISSVSKLSVADHSIQKAANVKEMISHFITGVFYTFGGLVGNGEKFLQQQGFIMIKNLNCIHEPIRISGYTFQEVNTQDVHLRKCPKTRFQTTDHEKFIQRVIELFPRFLPLTCQ